MNERETYYYYIYISTHMHTKSAPAPHTRQACEPPGHPDHTLYTHGPHKHDTRKRTRERKAAVSHQPHAAVWRAAAAPRQIHTHTLAYVRGAQPKKKGTTNRLHSTSVASKGWSPKSGFPAPASRLVAKSD